jgi:hypothetical protein
VVNLSLGELLQQCQDPMSEVPNALSSSADALDQPIRLENHQQLPPVPSDHLDSDTLEGQGQDISGASSVNLVPKWVIKRNSERICIWEFHVENFIENACFSDNNSIRNSA